MPEMVTCGLSTRQMMGFQQTEDLAKSRQATLDEFHSGKGAGKSQTSLDPDIGGMGSSVNMFWVSWNGPMWSMKKDFLELEFGFFKIGLQICQAC